jgi:hypothetical protein
MRIVQRAARLESDNAVIRIYPFLGSEELQVIIDAYRFYEEHMMFVEKGLILKTPPLYERLQKVHPELSLPPYMGLKGVVDRAGGISVLEEARDRKLAEEKAAADKAKLDEQERLNAEARQTVEEIASNLTSQQLNIVIDAYRQTKNDQKAASDRYGTIADRTTSPQQTAYENLKREIETYLPRYGWWQDKLGDIVDRAGGISVLEEARDRKLAEEKAAAGIVAKECNSIAIEYLHLLNGRKYAKVERVRKTSFGRNDTPIQGLIATLTRDSSLIIEPQDLAGSLESEKRLEQVSRLSSRPILTTAWGGVDPICKQVPQWWDPDRIRRLRDDLKQLVERERIHQIRQEYMLTLSQMLKQERQDRPLGSLNLSYDQSAETKSECIEGITVKEVVAKIEEGLTYTDGVLFLSDDTPEKLLSKGGYSTVYMSFRPSYEGWYRSEESWNTVQGAQATLKQLQDFARHRQELRDAKTRETERLTTKSYVLDVCRREQGKFLPHEAQAYDMRHEMSRWQYQMAVPIYVKRGEEGIHGHRKE